MKRFSLILILFLFAGVLLLFSFIKLPQKFNMTSISAAPSLEAFADCLTEKGASMYGADWCPACKQQKKLFGEAFSHVRYVNCDFEKKDCNKNGIERYPTWIIGKKRFIGVQTLSELSQITECTS